MMKKNVYLFSIIVILSFCNKKQIENTCPESNNIFDEFISDQHYILTKDGEVYIRKNGVCNFFLQYFTPGFENNYYLEQGKIYTGFGGYSIETLTELNDDFEAINTFNDLFITSTSTVNHKWTDFIVQSPANPTVEAYVALRKCILAGNCSFEDNRIDYVHNVNNNSGICLKYTALKPGADMITSKSSLSNSLIYADLNDEVTIEADFYIESGFPFSIIDLENKWFDEYPGIRLVFDENKNLAAELKYGLKPWYTQQIGNEVQFPEKQWVNVKAHFILRHDENGLVKVWQNNALIIDSIGKTLPTSNSIQTNIELGISATNQHTVMFVDNFRMKVNKMD